MLHKLTERLQRVLQWSLALLVGLMLIPVTLQIVTRYTPFLPPQLWTEEAARFCLIWAIMIGAAVVLRERGHFDIDLLPTPKTAAGEAWARLVVDVPMLVFALIFLWTGWQVFIDSRREISEITEISMGWFYVAFPISAVCWVVYQVGHIAQSLRSLFAGKG